MTVRPDPTFHATAKLAMQAPVESYAYTLMLSGDFSQPDGLAVVDVNPKSKKFGKVVHSVIMPNKGDEFHHFGWNACSSALSPLSGLDAGHQAAATLVSGNLVTAATVSVVHTAAMIASGGLIAIAVYRWLGPKFISQSWFNLDIVWAVSLILVGGIGIASAGYVR